MAKFIVFKTEHGRRSYVGAMITDDWWVDTPAKAFHYDDEAIPVKIIIGDFIEKYGPDIIGYAFIDIPTSMMIGQTMGL